MPSLSLGTLKSSPDERGNCHRLSIDALSSKSYESITTYQAQIYSNNRESDPRDRELVIAKFAAAKDVDTDRWAQCELKKSELARKVARKFNEFIRQVALIRPRTCSFEGTRIDFVKSQTATLDSTSFVHRKRKKGDCLVFEDIVEAFSHFIDITGNVEIESRQRSRSRSRSSSTSRRSSYQSNPIPIPATHRDRRRSFLTTIENRRDSYTSSIESITPPSYEESEFLTRLDQLLGTHHDPSETQRIRSLFLAIIRNGFNLDLRPSTSFNNIDDDVTVECDDRDIPYSLLQTFVHFFLCQTSGQAVICGLKGNKNNDQYKLTTPVIHSLGRHFGERDGGEQAMRTVLENHRCSQICRNLPDVFSVLSQASPSHTFNWQFV
ncbi:hypothetical protein RRG08_058299 [Elysia crispata]|uniref:Alpha-type protein kinase domain-containing protein n=1 Tax=Elysia crispata TaxID=231223 RepID=A0AAE0YVT6_9GAST|nr:hypothetical protein RRG08_058299 [Elysia crispata]